MSKELSVTRFLHASKSGDEDANTKIVQYFWERAKRAALKNWNWQDLRHVSGSDIAGTALRNALKVIQDPKSEVTNRDDFLGLVIVIARRKAISELRRETAKKRRGKHISIDAVDDESTGGRGARVARELASSEPTPPELIAAEELGGWFEKRLRKERDQVKRIVCILGVIKKYTGPEILNILHAADLPKKSLPDERTIQFWVKEMRDRLRNELQTDYADFFKWLDDVEEKTKEARARTTKSQPRKRTAKKPSKKQPGKGEK